MQNDRGIRQNHGIIGFLAGTIAGVFFQPLEIIKLGMIIGPQNNLALKNQLKKLNFIQQFKHITKNIIETEGIKGFYRSIIPTIIRCGGGSAIYFYSLQKYNVIRIKLLNYQSQQDNECYSCQFVVSALARLTSTVLLNPVAIVGTRIEITGFNEYKGIIDGLMKLYKNEGIIGYFRGVVPCCIKDGPFAGLYYPLYIYIREYLDEIFDFSLANKTLLAGLSAGFIATFTTHPFELLRSKSQVEGKSIKILSGFKKIYQEEGLVGFFHGVSPRLIKKPLLNGLVFCQFEIFHKIFTDKKW